MYIQFPTNLGYVAGNTVKATKAPMQNISDKKLDPSRRLKENLGYIREVSAAGLAKVQLMAEIA